MGRSELCILYTHRCRLSYADVRRLPWGVLDTFSFSAELASIMGSAFRSEVNSVVNLGIFQVAPHCGELVGELNPSVTFSSVWVDMSSKHSITGYRSVLIDAVVTYAPRLVAVKCSRVGISHRQHLIGLDLRLQPYRLLALLRPIYLLILVCGGHWWMSECKTV
jgi:hypothetical protein